MAIKYEKITNGSVLLDVRRVSTGSPTMRRWSCWRVKIIEITGDGALVSWNGNPPEKWSRSQLEKLYVKPPKAYREQDGNWDEGVLA